MIKSFVHKGLEAFYRIGSKAGIQASHASKLRILLTALSAALSPNDLRAPASWRLHPLQGDHQDHWSLTVNGNWRVTFKFEGADVVLVDYVDYH